MNRMSPPVILVGTGVVGRAILRAHLDAGVAVRVADVDEASLRETITEAKTRDPELRVGALSAATAGLAVATLDPNVASASGQDGDRLQSCKRGPTLVIESIVERLDVKRDFFRAAEEWAGEDAILCSNTSTLRIGDIAVALERPERMCGMHFFMPVDQRWAAEVVCGEPADAGVVAHCQEHVRRINKTPLVVRDSPGFIVNRLLSPYLNEAMLLLSRGVSPARLERAALDYGMPMSPLELIDWIGTRTMFDAGRAIWQAFPERFDPSPLLGAMIKAKRSGRAAGAGFFDYHDGVRGPTPAPQTIELAARYRRNEREFADADIRLLLSIPMWIEAALALRQGVTDSHEDLDVAMRGGLAYRSSESWLNHFQSLGSKTLRDAIATHSEESKSMRAPQELLDLLGRFDPTEAINRFADRKCV